VNDEDIECVEIQNTANGGLKGTTVSIVVDNEVHKHYDYVFGGVTSRASRKSIGDLSVFNSENWDLKSSMEQVDGPAKDKCAGFLVVINEPDKELRSDDWRAINVWGFETINGEKRYVRRVHFESPTFTKDLVIVYDTIKG
jgi:hypothetical protein